MARELQATIVSLRALPDAELCTAKGTINSTRSHGHYYNNVLLGDNKRMRRRTMVWGDISFKSPSLLVGFLPRVYDGIRDTMLGWLGRV